MTEYKLVKKADRQQIIKLYKQAGWWTCEDECDQSFVDRIVEKSFLFAVAVQNGEIIGMGRAISDGISDAYIQDVTVQNELRGQGIGSEIIQLLVVGLKERKIGWIGLISEPGAESFYSSLGFEVMKDHTPYIFTSSEAGNDEK